MLEQLTLESATAPRKARKARAEYLPDIHRLLPQSADAERGVLSAFLLDPREVGGICAEAKLAADNFHLGAHKTIYSVLMELWDATKPIDFITLTQILSDRGSLEAVGGAAYITELFTFLPTAANAAYYIGIVEEKATLRGMIRVCAEFGGRSYDEQEDVPALLSDAEAAILGIAQDRIRGKAADMKQSVLGALTAISTLHERRGEISGLSTGFADLDKMTDGLHGSEMIVIAARPSMGKTALAMNMAEHIAVDLGKAVAVFSLEMSTQQLVQRLLCSRARVNMARVRDGFLNERDFPNLQIAASKLASAKMFIDDTSALSILELRAKARRLKQQHNIAAIFIDYIQLLRSTSRRGQDNRQIEIAEISNGLKALAKELDLPVVVLAQLNRNPENRGPSGSGGGAGRPRLSDLRESGSIEQDADVVGLLLRDEYYADSDTEKEALKGMATLIIAKSRNGPVGDLPLTFLKEFTRFETRASEPSEA